MNYPKPLCPGDTIGLIAPCSPIPANRLMSCIQVIHALGYQTVLGESCTKSLHGYLAGPDYLRACDINHMFANPEIQAIFCLRGGYGSSRIMDLLDYPMIRRHPKIFVGYSDVTSFHLAFHTLCDLVTFHGPMVSSNMVDDFDDYTKESFLEALSMPDHLVFHNPENQQLHPLIPGKAKGPLIGGCLSLVAPCLHTFYQPDFCGTILFLEDVDESLPRCDKLLHQLIHSGVLDQVNGLLLGNFIECTNPNDSEYTMNDLFQDLFSCIKKPVLTGIQSGHGKPMATLPFGTQCTIDTSKQLLQFDYE